MAKTESRHLVTPRDLEILAALDRTPLTALQLLKLSGTFEQAFGSERMVRERLQSLCAAGWTRSAYYATAMQGAAPKYFFLTAVGYALVHGHQVEIPSRRSFAPLPVTRHRHSRALADFVVQLYVTAHAANFHVENYYPENVLRLSIDGESLCPDGAFELRTPDGEQYNFVVEIDCSTERVASTRDVDSWQRKIRLYDRLQDLNLPHRFRVLALCTGGRERLRHILADGGNSFSQSPTGVVVWDAAARNFSRTPIRCAQRFLRITCMRAVALVP